MRTKTLLLSAAAMVAGLISAHAQSNVYSANIVGYVTVTNAASQYALWSLPLDSGTNTLNALVPNPPTGSTILVWTGSGYSSSTKSPAGWLPNLTLTPGQGFFIRSTAAGTNTFVGSIAVPVGGSVTNTLAGGLYSLVGSPIPYTDSLNGTNLNLQAGTGSTVLVWGGAGYSSSTKSPAGWLPNLSINPGQGFFVRPTGPTNWVQNLIVQ